jgi:hypothetical protein
VYYTFFWPVIRGFMEAKKLLIGYGIFAVAAEVKIAEFWI